MRGLVLVGAGGHAKVVIEILRALGEHVEWCVGAPGSHERCLDVPVLTGDENLRRLRGEGYVRAFVAVGSNALRERLSDSAVAAGFSLASAISPYAIVSPTARLGRGVAVMPGAVVNAACTIDDLAIINTGATVDHDCRIGRAVHVGPGCAIAGNVTVGAAALLGAGCTVLPDIRIGRDVVLGAGAVAVSDIPDGVTAYGVPARVRSQGADRI